MDGCRATCTYTAEISESSTSPHGATEWIAYQRDFLARIFPALAAARESKEQEVALFQKSSAQLTIFGQASSSSKTPHTSEQKGGTLSSGNSWRVDIPGRTERLKRLMSGLDINANGGGASLPTGKECEDFKRLPTLMACDGSKGPTRPEREDTGGASLHTALRRLPTLTASDGTGGPGVSQKRTGGMNLRTAVYRLPTLCATDYKSPYSAEGYHKQAQKRLKPLRDTLAHTTGHRLTAEFAEWWMGWPLRWTATQKSKE